jgi:hypothetical protein
VYGYIFTKTAAEVRVAAQRSISFLVRAPPFLTQRTTERVFLPPQISAFDDSTFFEFSKHARFQVLFF